MEGETRVVSDNSGLINAQPISVLVVDDDTTCLAIVAAKLKKFQYHVVTVKHPNDALCTLRIKGDAFDLVVSDVHMPEMNGIQLQQVIAREFNLPVVLMSADKKEDVVLEGLGCGAAFYIAKPVSSNDLKDLWQFAITKKKKSDVVIEETGCFTHEKITSSNKTSSSDEVGGTAPSMNDIAGSTSSVNEVSPDHNKDPKRKSPQKEESSGKSKKITVTAPQKKKKVIWTNALHDRFLEAVTSIGLDRAVPKKILEVMNVPYLTRENVASHLQKYRIFLRRVTDDANLKLHYYDKRRAFSPMLAQLSRTRSSSVFHNSLTRRHNPTPEPFFGAKKNAFFLNREGSSSDILGQSGFGQSRLLSNGGSMLIPNVVRTSRTTDNNSSRLMQNMYQNITSVQGNLSGTLSAHFEPLVPASTTGVNLVSADYGVPNSCINYGISSPNFNYLSATTSKDSATRTNFVGLNISNVQHLLVKSAGKQPACDGRINNLASELEFQNSTTVGTGLGSNESPAINVQMDGDLLWDDALAARNQMLMQSNVYKEMGNVENGLGESSYDQSAAYSYSTMFDLDELTNLPLDQECNLNPNNPTSTYPIVNLQNQVQDYDNFSSFDQALNKASTDQIMNVQNQVQDYDNVLSFDQALNGASADPIDNFQNQVQNYDNISLFDQALNEASSDPIVNVQNQVQNYGYASAFDQVLNQRDDDDLLESLLGLYEENHNLDGI